MNKMYVISPAPPPHEDLKKKGGGNTFPNNCKSIVLLYLDLDVTL